MAEAGVAELGRSSPSAAAFVADGWARHGADPDGVFRSFPDGIGLLADGVEFPPLAGLIVHVAGEHLGRWDDGLDLLARLERHPAFPAGTPDGQAVARSRAVLEWCRSPTTLDGFDRSDQARIRAIASAALLGQGDLARARADFEAAVVLLGAPSAADPAVRAVAVTSNNLAAALEAKPELTGDERTFMLRCAQVARDCWGIAGTWREAERAEYRLAKSHLRAGDPAGALQHAERCWQIVEANGTDPGEAAFACEVLAEARHRGGDRTGATDARDRMAALIPSIDGPLQQAAATALAALPA